MKCHGKVLAMRNMRGMQLAQPSDEACKSHGAIQQWYGMIPGPSMRILLEESGGPQENEEKNTTKKKTTKNVRAPKSGLSTPLPLHKNKSSMAFG
jgi:hypothetical protein